MLKKYIIKIGGSYYSEKIELGNENFATIYATENEAYAKAQQLMKKYEGVNFSIIEIVEREIKLNF